MSTDSKKKTALVFGSTGLVGTELVHQLVSSAHYEKVILVNRKPTGLASPKISELIFDFEKITENPKLLIEQLNFPVHAVFCALGTTIKKARSQKAFYRVDHDYALMSAQVADLIPASVFVMVSALSTDLNSKVYYSRVKAEAERDISHLAFAKKSSIHFLRPSLLLGDRKEFRFGERLAIVTAPLFNWMMAGPLKRYKAIRAEQVAASMIRFAGDLRPGVHIHENETLF